MSIAQGQTEMGNSCQLPPPPSPPNAALYVFAPNIYMVCGHLCMCVCVCIVKIFHDILFAVRKSNERALLHICALRATVKGIWQDLPAMLGHCRLLFHLLLLLPTWGVMLLTPYCTFLSTFKFVVLVKFNVKSKFHFENHHTRTHTKSFSHRLGALLFLFFWSYLHVLQLADNCQLCPTANTPHRSRTENFWAQKNGKTEEKKIECQRVFGAVS